MEETKEFIAATETNDTANYTYITNDITSVKLDFDNLSTWMNSATGLPVCSFISVYEASGLSDAIADYSHSHNDAQIAPVDNLLCNFYTLQHIKNFLNTQWATYSLDIDGDNHVFWDTKKYPAGTKHYPKRLKKKVEACLSQDFANYCCGLDDELPDDVIAFRTYTKTETAQEPSNDDQKEK